MKTSRSLGKEVLGIACVVLRVALSLSFVLSGAHPHVIFRSAEGTEISRETLSDMSAPDLIKLLEKHGLQARKRHVAPAPKEPQATFEVDGVTYKFYERAVYRSDADAKAAEEGTRVAVCAVAER